MKTIQTLEQKIRKHCPELQENGWHDIEIISHPIHLEHILRAIERSGRCDGVAIYEYGMIEYTDDELETHNTYYYLSLPLSAQSEETLKFIDELID